MMPIRTRLAQRVRPWFDHVRRAEGSLRDGADGKAAIAVVAISTFVEPPLPLLAARLQILLALLFDIAVLKYTGLSVAGEGVEKEKF